MLPPTIILAAVDFSEQSRQGLELAARLARHCQAALHIMHAEDPLLVAAAAESGVDLTADTRAELQRFIDSVPAAAGCALCRDVVAGPAARTILNVAHREGADLIVMGASGMSGAGRFLFGSVTAEVMLRADRSVIVTPDGWVAPHLEANDLSGIGPLVVGVDYSEPSLLAAKAACALAERLATRVEAVHVVPDLPVIERWRPHAERVLAERVTLARRELAALVAAVAPGVLTTRVTSGDTAEQLALAASPIGTRQPLLILGRRGAGSHDGVPGATANRVAALARVPVLMYREPPDAA